MLSGLPSSHLSASYLEPGDQLFLSSALPLGVEYGDGGGTINFAQHAPIPMAADGKGSSGRRADAVSFQPVHDESIA
jgi:hypothetical protein